MKVPFWLMVSLALAGIYNLAWGAWVVLFPHVVFDWLGVARPNYIELWQCIGMIVGVYGVGYLAAATHPTRHWPIVLVGFLGKIFGPIGFVQAVLQGTFPPAFGIIIVFNDLIWWVPFGWILILAWRERHPNSPALGIDQAMSLPVSPQGSLKQLSQSAPLVVVFLRHSGCCFFGSVLEEIARNRRQKPNTARVAFIHMGIENPAQDSEKEIWISDPKRALYRAFGVPRGTLWQTLGPKVWVRAIQLLRNGGKIGPLEGDGFQMPALFRLEHGRIVKRYVAPSLEAELPVGEFL